MALGTETIGRVDILAGPGNAYVAEAQRQLYGEVGIDRLAGPTEILIVAAEAADPFVVAIDLLSQAEHGPDSPAVLITSSETLGREVIAHVGRILPGMPTRDYAGPAWRDHGQVIVVDGLDEAYVLADDFASEHVEILTAAPREALERLRNHGSLFLGEATTVTYREIRNTDSSVALGELCGRVSRVELFEGHARSGDVRVVKYTGAELAWAPRTPAATST